MNKFLAFWQNNKRRNLWQHPIWADFQTAIGRKVWRVENEGATAIVIKHNLPKGLCWLEVPRGPLFENEESLLKLLEEIKELGQKEGAIFIRMSPFEKLKITKHDHQPQTSLVVDLDQSEEEILKQMKPKGRYNIKVAQKHGVTVHPSDDIETFHHLLSSTGFRDGFGIHPKSHYQKMFESMPDNAQLLLAEYSGEVIAGGLFVYLNEWGIYYYGASVASHRKVMAPYLIQWEAMKEAKKRGCKHYDFLGIAPENSKNHPWAGVTDFKRKFGGRTANYPQAREMVLRPFLYFAYRLYKKFR
ncbi:peptidoglycan bridge formation glycyltransferase FemA/FemB family protein [Candidatus Pacearchaeota archaeon]|nr:peptidoglycan bridge formation glycyltransferase FemA/FemB family protein [Candidatus Pacearchaeota archaeon]